MNTYIVFHKRPNEVADRLHVFPGYEVEADAARDAARMALERASVEQLPHGSLLVIVNVATPDVWVFGVERNGAHLVDESDLGELI